VFCNSPLTKYVLQPCEIATERRILKKSGNLFTQVADNPLS